MQDFWSDLDVLETDVVNDIDLQNSGASEIDQNQIDLFIIKAKEARITYGDMAKALQSTKSYPKNRHNTLSKRPKPKGHLNELMQQKLDNLQKKQLEKMATKQLCFLIGKTPLGACTETST